MAENKTKATEASVKGYLAAIKDPGRRADCEALSALMSKATKQQPKMWGAGIVGFGSYHYKLKVLGQIVIAAVAARKRNH